MKTPNFITKHESVQNDSSLASIEAQTALEWSKYLFFNFLTIFSDSSSFFTLGGHLNPNQNRKSSKILKIPQTILQFVAQNAREDGPLTEKFQFLISHCFT